jgi:hypothetical protein
MRRSFRWRWAGSAAVAWLAIALLNAVLPAEVHAGCNHPWVKGTGFSPPLVDLSLLDPSDHTAIPEPKDRPGPCAGGACSRAPELPPSSTAPVSGTGPHWGDLTAAIPLLFPGCQRLSPDPDSRHPASSLRPIERPPRFAPAR